MLALWLVASLVPFTVFEPACYDQRKSVGTDRLHEILIDFQASMLQLPIRINFQLYFMVGIDLVFPAEKSIKLRKQTLIRKKSCRKFEFFFEFSNCKNIWIFSLVFE